MGAGATQPKEFRVVRDTIFLGNSPNPSAWTVLDLSPFVGSRYAFVVLRISSDAVGCAGYAVKPAYEAQDCLPNGFPANAGGCHAVDLAQNKPGYVCINTSEQGYIAWFCTVVNRQTLIRIGCFIA